MSNNTKISSISEIVKDLRAKGELDEEAFARFKKRYKLLVYKIPGVLITISLFNFFLSYIRHDTGMIFNSVALTSIGLWLFFHNMNKLKKFAYLYTKGQPVIGDVVSCTSKTAFGLINGPHIVSYKKNDTAGKLIISGYESDAYWGICFFDGGKNILLLLHPNNYNIHTAYTSYYNNLFCLTKNKERFDHAS